MDDKISVIMAVYNAQDTLAKAIESVLAQTYKNFEFIICDDVSTDNSFNLLKQFAEKDSRIIIIQNQKNSKLSFSLNHCLRYATGKFVARMDADDLCAPDRFEKQINFLKDNPQYDLVGTAMQRFDDNGTIDVVVPPEFVDKYSMRHDTPFLHATIMTYKRVYDKLGGYTVSERTVRGQDVDLWFRFFAAGFNGHNIQEPLYLVREDMAAIKRRTFKVRLNAYKTTRLGFKLLGFPHHWIIKPTFVFIIKSLVPYSIIAKYRKYQKNKFHS